MKKEINIVWLKRDIRSQDHQPLYEAEQAAIPYVIIYCFEPNLISYPDVSLRHLRFIYHSILDLNKSLEVFGRKVIVFHNDAIRVFQYLNTLNFKIATIFSYQESGTEITWQRDKEISTYLKGQRIEWREYQKNGVIRGIRNRQGWDKYWYTTMSMPVLRNNYTKQTILQFENPFPLNDDFEAELLQYPEYFQPAGEIYAWKYLNSFVEKRGKDYHRFISKPRESRTSCTRLSPYLAFGNLSIRQAVRFIKSHPNFSFNKRAFTGAITRMKWHDHFIQKFEVECAYEKRCINKGYELLERKINSGHLIKWKTGQTGFPLVDACMRCLHTTGWINFRMRAMVVSFLCHHLDQDWRTGAYHLAKLFLDYEPGIHYPQIQMQAGTTGVNIIRIYNPLKQSKDHDPKGIFIKKWVPELQNVPEQFIHEPNNMTTLDESFCGVKIGVDYPRPIINLSEAGKKASLKIWGHRKNELVRLEKNRIVKTHVRPNSRKK